MLTTVEGIVRNGEVTLDEVPPSVKDGVRVLVTFLTPAVVDLAALGIAPEVAAELRARLASFAEGWDSPEMDSYDDYDAAKSALQAR